MGQRGRRWPVSWEARPAGKVAPEDQREGQRGVASQGRLDGACLLGSECRQTPEQQQRLLAEGTLTLPEMMTLAWASFPGIMDRFEVALYVEGVSEGRSRRPARTAQAPRSQGRPARLMVSAVSVPLPIMVARWPRRGRTAQEARSLPRRARRPDRRPSSA